MIVLHLCTTNDVNGNPRRLYMPLESGPKNAAILAVIEEGYIGESVLASLFPDRAITYMFRINVPVSEYKNWKKIGKECGIYHD